MRNARDTSECRVCTYSCCVRMTRRAVVLAVKFILNRTSHDLALRELDFGGSLSLVCARLRGRRLGNGGREVDLNPRTAI